MSESLFISRPTWLAVLLIMLGTAVCAGVAATAATYHVDPAAGSDTAVGTSPESAWKSLGVVSQRSFSPGDRILLKAGARFSGQLRLKGSGAPGRAITVAAYGEGPRPRIDGEGKVADTVLLEDGSYWEIRGLEITNHGAERAPWRTGLRVVARNRVVRGIRIEDLHVHDVNGDLRKSHEGCGIFFENVSRNAWFEDLRIEKCLVERTDRNGICQRSAGGTRSTGIVIRGNRLNDIGGDGIKIWGSNGALVEHNVLRGGRMRAQDAAAGIWPFASDDTVIQHNDVSGMKGTIDGQGFDSDYHCRRTVIQYNHSHHNEGGFLLVCAPGRKISEDAVIRYNISRYDGIRGARVFQFGGSARRTRIYNNTIYIGPDQDLPMISCNSWEGGHPGEFTFSNNIFLVEGRVRYVFDTARDHRFQANAFIGRHDGRPEDPMALEALPPFAEPEPGTMRFSRPEHFRPAAGVRWPLGVIIPDNGGRDFFGNPVPADRPPAIGAVQPGGDAR